MGLRRDRRELGGSPRWIIVTIGLDNRYRAIVKPQPNVIPKRASAECLPGADREDEPMAKLFKDSKNSARIT